MNNTRNQHVLVLDGDQFSTLAIVRSLGRKDLKVTVGYEHGGVQPIAGYSKYAQEVIFYTNPLVDSDPFVDGLVAYLKNNKVDLLIAVTDRTLIPLVKRKREIEQYTCLAAPEADVLDWVSDKNKTFALAERIGVPIPKSITVSTLSELEGVETGLGFPIVIKPSRSIADAKRDIRVKLDVQYAFSGQELQAKCAAILPFTPVVVQEYFSGVGVGVEVLADHGEIVYAFQHKRLHELPLTGGGSCLRESVPVNPKLLSYSQEIIRAIKWHGVAMVEFKYCEKTDDCRLMEINGRFWGSLPLAVNSGADFPYYLYQLLILGEKTQAKPAAVGIQCRKLKEDLYWFFIVLLRREKSPLVVWPAYKQLWSDFASTFSHKHYLDSWASDDLRPWFVDLMRTAQWFIGLFYQPISYRLQKILFSWRKQTGVAKKRLPKAKHLLFLCYGNINRSVLAEKCLNLYLKDSGKNVMVTSAGFHPKANRPADPEMVVIASQQGIDLSQWSSKIVNESMLADADLVFVMEVKHYQMICDKFPQYRNKAQLLGTITEDTDPVPLEIADPYGRPNEIYRDCFQQVDAACKIIFDLLD